LTVVTHNIVSLFVISSATENVQQIIEMITTTMKVSSTKDLTITRIYLAPSFILETVHISKPFAAIKSSKNQNLVIYQCTSMSVPSFWLCRVLYHYDILPLSCDQVVFHQSSVVIKTICATK
jgi:hypothetical protein